MPKILEEQAVRERSLIEYTDDDHSVACFLYDNSEWPEKCAFELQVTYPSDEWLDALSSSYIDFAKLRGAMISKHPAPTAEEMANYFAFYSRRLLPHILLDSFTVIESGSHARKYDREIPVSPLQDALINMIRDGIIDIQSVSPREFETLVANVLRSMGFEKVILKRYSKDGGIDIYAIIAEGESVESVVVEVKKQKKPCGLNIMDRLNGVRDRENANRALLVSSGTITRDAFSAYRAKAQQITGYAFNELLALLRDVGDWETTPGGLWTKRT